MSNGSSFFLDWYAGPRAQVELFSPGGRARPLELKYTPPFHATMRPPVEERPIGPEDLGAVNDQLDWLVEHIDHGRRGSVVRAGKPAETTVGREEVKNVGRQLFKLVVPTDIHKDLRGPRLFLEIGLDEALLDYPFELMHDGENFLCLKHYVGRFVNASSTPPTRPRPTSAGQVLNKLSILLLSVPNPQPQNGTFDPLPEADAETYVIAKTFDGVDGIELNLVPGRDATYNRVEKELEKGYHIVHFNGHAEFNDQNPGRSSLVLHDRKMTTGQISSFLENAPTPPILCFVNACETARTGAAPAPGPRKASWKTRYGGFSLARAFLETGAYLLGSRWKVSDGAAAEFAKRFYSSLLLSEKPKPIGEAILDARCACLESCPPEDFAWATYVYYGDPRVYFRRETGAAPAPAFRIG